MTAYHYTRGHRLPMIINDQEIVPSMAGCMPGEVPVVWLSEGDEFPPTAAGGNVEVLRCMGGGAFRIGVDTTHLIRWADFREQSGIHPAMIFGLEVAARDQGDDPEGWWVHIGPVPEHRWLSTEVWFREGWHGA